jgi:hypothetical protein
MRQWDIDAGVNALQRDDIITNQFNILIPGQRQGMSLSDSFYSKNADLSRSMNHGVNSIRNKIVGSLQNYPSYTGEVLEKVPSLSLNSSGSLKNVSDKVFSQSSSGINSGDVFTGSLNTSHSSYLPQLKEVFKYKQGTPQFLGYKPMNTMGFLSDYGYSHKDVVKYLNTEIDAQVNRKIIPENIQRPYVKGEHVLLPHYGIKQFKDGGELEKYNDGGPAQENYNDYSVSAPEGFQGDGYSNVGRDYSPAWGGQFAMGGSLPGSVGFMYARTNDPAPSNGKYAKKTKASAQDGKVVANNTRVTQPMVAPLKKSNNLDNFKSWWPWLSNLASGGSGRKEETPEYGKLTDLYRYYGGEPLKYNVIEKSQYKPSLAKDPNTNYISINDTNFLKEVVGAYNRASDGNLKSSTHGKEFKYSNKDTYSVSGYNNRKEAWALGHYNVSKGKDEKGEYISYYDKFDATPGKGENLWEKIGIVKPFEIYGRVYIDPKTGKPKLQNGGEMKYYQEGLDFKPKTISRDGSQLVKLDQLTNFTNYNKPTVGGWLDKYEG